MLHNRVFALILVLGAVAGARLPGREKLGVASASERQARDNDTPEAAADEILALPGFSNPRFASRHYGGYVTVDEAHERRLFYYFVESERDPANDPVVLWLNGGPGCSSFDGFVYEQGPFIYSMSHGSGGRGVQVELSNNPHAWSKVANMIFLDSPAGVGLSYSAHAADYAVDDSRTARDADAFLRGWFRRFPHFGANEFYVSGESYAGIYVPNLVRQVLLGNEAAEQPHINIVGYLVGNGCTDERYDGNAHPPFAAGKSLLPWKAFRELEAECGGGEYWNRSQGTACDKLWGKLAFNLEALNVYDTLEDCFHDTPGAALDSGSGRGNGRGKARSSRGRSLHTGQAVLGGEGGALLGASAAAAAASSSADAATGGAAAAESGSSKRGAALRAERLAAAGLVGVWPLPGGTVRPGPVLNWAHVNVKLGLLGLTPPCTDSRAADLWLNDPYVRDAIHAAPVSAIGPWTLCSDKIFYTRNHGSMIPIHINNTKGHGLRALIYSGDHDMAVPHTGSEAWTSDLGFPVKSPWQPWFVADDQVAGYVVEYGHGLTYATIKGAGHMVPETNPREALAMFERFLAGKSLAGEDQ